MKQIYSLFIIAFLILGCEREGWDRPEFLYVSGVVVDKANGSPIQNAEIYIERSSFMSVSIIDTVLYTDSNGKFGFKIEPVDDFSYHFLVEKSGYHPVNKMLDRDLKNHAFNVQMEKM